MTCDGCKHCLRDQLHPEIPAEHGSRPAQLAAWPEFMAVIWQRLKQGARDYGDHSFAREPSDLAGEIEQELADVAGWAFILWVRVRNLRERIP